jgi:DNA mismatch endonuclease, patch repair protein
MYKTREIKVPKFCESEGFYTTKAKSEAMSKMRTRDTFYEIKLRKELWNRGYRYRKNDKTLPGKPDIVFGKYKLVIFVDGDFWHGYNWKNRKQDFKTNRGFWIPKIERNMQRDSEQNRALKEQGFLVIRFWENELKNKFDECTEKVVNAISKFKQKAENKG